MVKDMRIKIQKLTNKSIEIQVKEKMPNGAFKQIGIILHNIKPTKVLKAEKPNPIYHIELFHENHHGYMGNIYWFNVKPTIRLETPIEI